MRRSFLGAMVGAAVLACATSARAGDLFVDGGLAGGTSTWASDPSGYGSLRFGYRFADLVGIYGMGRLGYSAVDERMITLIELGGQIWGRLGPTRPYARLGLTHQHEESVDAVEGDWGGALFGVGDGIRHRAGGEAALGVAFPLYTKDKLELSAWGETSLLWNPDDRGPHVYGLGALGFGFSYRL